MFPFVIGTNRSEEIAVTKDFLVVAELNGVLRNGTSIIDPTIEVEWSNSETLGSLPSCNYMYIPSFGRYYFIRNISSDYQGLILIEAHVDVLMSFATQIKANKGIVHRQEANWNLYLNDGVLKCYQNPHISTIAFPEDKFVGHSNVLLVAGYRNSGLSFAPGISGAGNTTGKTTGGLYAYAVAQLGRPYWYGTFGQVADAALLDDRRSAYPSQYTATDFDQQFGQRVHDCVGLIKGYRWSDTPNSVPVPKAWEDVDVYGLYSQCTRASGSIPPVFSGLTVGCVVFKNRDHAGVYVGEGKVIEAKSHADGVVQTLLLERGYTDWGIPDWMETTTGVS